MSLTLFWSDRQWLAFTFEDTSVVPASYYLVAFRDKFGDLYRGELLYRVTVPADTPARDFWSIIAYEFGSSAVISNPQNRIGVSSYDKDKLAVNDDGSVDVYIGPKARKGLENNWIPTGRKNFWLIARFYGPEKRLFEKKWKLPDVEMAN